MPTTTNFGVNLPTVGADETAWGQENNDAHQAWDTKFATAESAWTETTPTPTSSSGAFGTGVTASVLHKRASATAKTVHLDARIVIPVGGAGTAAGALIVALPVGARAGRNYAFAGREGQGTGVSVVGQVISGALNIFRYDGATIIADSRTIHVTGTYEAA